MTATENMTPEEIAEAMKPQNIPDSPGLADFGRRMDELIRDAQEEEDKAEEEKQRLYDFVKNDIMPLVIQQSGIESERARLCRLLYFVLRNRTVENWGPHELTMADAMRLP